MARVIRNFYQRAPSERSWMIESTWCNTCRLHDLGLENPIEFEEEGRVYVESELGKGSAFSVEFPRELVILRDRVPPGPSSRCAGRGRQSCAGGPGVVSIGVSGISPSSQIVASASPCVFLTCGFCHVSYFIVTNS